MNKYQGSGKVNKQNGGKGQFAHCVIEIEPLESGKGFEFVNGTVGGSIPKEFIPSIEKGVKSAMKNGRLGGYPVTDVKVTVIDGSFHAVDSSTYAFQEAGSLAFKDASLQAPMSILEPMGKLEVNIPHEFTGTVMGDLHKRRGELGKTNSTTQGMIMEAIVPISEMFGYATRLRNITQGRGTFTMEPNGYQEVPLSVEESLSGVKI